VLLIILRDYWQVARPNRLLFPGKQHKHAISTTSIRNTMGRSNCRRARR
jgi:hypothetical protein